MGEGVRTSVRRRARTSSSGAERAASILLKILERLVVSSTDHTFSCDGGEKKRGGVRVRARGVSPSEKQGPLEWPNRIPSSGFSLKTRSRSLTVAQARPLPQSACRSIRLPPFKNHDIRVRARVQAKLCLHAAGPSTDSLTLARPTVACSRWSQAARPRRGQGSLDVPVCCNHPGDHHLGCVPSLFPFRDCH